MLGELLVTHARACATVILGCGTNSRERLVRGLGWGRSRARLGRVGGDEGGGNEAARLTRRLARAGRIWRGSARRDGALASFANVAVASRPSATYEWAWLGHPCGTRRETYDLHRQRRMQRTAGDMRLTSRDVVVTVTAVPLPCRVVDVGDVVVPYVIEILF